MNSLIQNLINGNNTEARKQARRFQAWQIRDALENDGHFNARSAALWADWLKGRDCFQAACDADVAEKGATS